MRKPVDFKKFHGLQFVEIQHRPHLTLVMCFCRHLCINFFVLHSRHDCFPVLKKVLMVFDKGGIKRQKKLSTIPT